MFHLVRAAAALLFVSLAFQSAPAGDLSAPMTLPVVEDFLGVRGFGALNDQAPPETEQFGRLAGVWSAQPETRQMNGEFAPDAAGIWVWRYALDGFAIRDLWYQPGDNLPSYLKQLGRDYLLTSMRVYDPKAGKWNVAWMANGAGTAMGQDFGTFTAELREDRIVMTSPPGGGMGHQRVTFSEITGDSFLWESDYSMDGQSWMTVMRVRATRLGGE